MRRILLLFASAGVTLLAQTPDKCKDLANFQTPGNRLEITRAEIVAAGPAPARPGAQPGPVLPARCRVDGIIDRRTGPDGKTYGIRFAIALPEKWTGQYLQQGGGGLNGTVADRVASRRDAAGRCARLRGGHQRYRPPELRRWVRCKL